MPDAGLVALRVQVDVAQDFRPFRALIYASMFGMGSSVPMLSRIPRQLLATQFFRACDRLILAQKLGGLLQAEAHFRRRREVYLCRSAALAR